MNLHPIYPKSNAEKKIPEGTPERFRKVQLTLRISPITKAKLEAIALKKHRSLSNVIARYLEDFVDPLN